MSESDKARMAKGLRDHAASILQEAAQCGDAARRDDLLREAIARLDEARSLLNRLDDEAEGLGPGHSTTGHSTRRVH